MQRCDVAQRSVKKLWDVQLGRRRDDFQVHRKSRLTGHMSRRVEKQPACGASVLQPASPQCAALALHAHLEGLETSSDAASRLCSPQIGTFEH